MEAWCVKTGHFPDLLLGHQNGQRNEATQCVNESGFQNEDPRGQGPQEVAKKDFKQEVTEISERKLGHSGIHDRGPRRTQERSYERRLPFEVLESLCLRILLRDSCLSRGLGMAKARASSASEKSTSLTGWMCSENSSTKNWLERVRRTE
jgi:hypothetical protein